MALLVLMLIVEVWPMLTLIRWRIAIARGQTPEAVAVPVLARRIGQISTVQAVLVTAMVAAALAMARGFGAR